MKKVLQPRALDCSFMHMCSHRVLQYPAVTCSYFCHKYKDIMFYLSVIKDFVTKRIPKKIHDNGVSILL